MARRQNGLIALALGLLVAAQVFPGFLATPRAATRTGPVAPSSAQHAAIAPGYGLLPLSFELNAGQTDPSVRFLTHGSGYSLFLTPSAAVMALGNSAPAPARRDALHLPGMPAQPAKPQPTTVVGTQWLQANPNPIVTGEQPLPGKVNYFIGNDPAKWRTNIPTYQQVRYHNIYPGIDLIYYGNQGQLEYDFVVAPGANPARIALGFTGARQVGVDLLGNLSLALPGGALQQAKPLIYQSINGARRTVAGGYALAANQRVGFALGVYDRSLPLVIDPAYKFSTYLGGNDYEQGFGVAADSAGNAYVTGSTASTNFPNTSGVYQTTSAGGEDVFVSKFNASGGALTYSTYLGGSDSDDGFGIAVDSGGSAYITGITNSIDFPTVNPVQASYGGGFPGGGFSDAFVSKLNATGSVLDYSTYLGGTSEDQGQGIAVDASGNAYITGETVSTNFPTANPLQASNAGNGDAFVTKLNADGSALVYSTYLGGSGEDGASYDAARGAITVDASGNAYVTGLTNSTDFPTQNPLQASNAGNGDAFVTKLNADGSALVYSTYLGGSGGDFGLGIAVDASSSAYVTGLTGSTDFPTQNPLQASNAGNGDAFVTKLNADGSALVYSTYLGGNNRDFGNSITVNGSGSAFIAGDTASSNFPTAGPLQANYGGGSNFGDAFVSQINATGSALVFSTYLGGSQDEQGNGIAVDASGNAYVAGYSASANFPTSNALYSSIDGPSDAFVTKILTLIPQTTTGVFRPSNGALYLKNANTTGPADIALYYGLPGDQPITGDWTGKGYKSIGIYRNGKFYLRNSNTTGYADIVVPFGASTDIPLAGDWTGKGYDSIGYYQPSNSTFYLRDSNTPGPADHVARLGISGDVPIVGDWTAKGWDSIGVFRPSNGVVYLRNSNTTGFADINFVYGIAGDKPVVGDWTAQGKDTIGVDRAGNFLLRNSNTTGPANISFYLGVNGDDPIAGPWLAPASAPPPVHRGSPASKSSQHAAAIAPAWRNVPARR